MSLPTLYRYVDNVLKANAWALKLEREDGQNRDYFRALALCRKPREKATFPSLTDEQRAVIENIWFDRRFAANLGTLEMLYERFEEIAQGRGWEDYPSIKTVARYVKHLMDSRGAASARYLAANGSREWKNKMMLKGRRDATSLKVMEYVVGDEHTFDLWVQWVAPNGKVKAVRPKLVAWMDMKSRAIIGDVACIDANSQTLKESLVKMLYTTPGRPPYPPRRQRQGLHGADHDGPEPKEAEYRVRVRRRDRGLLSVHRHRGGGPLPPISALGQTHRAPVLDRVLQVLEVVRELRRHSHGLQDLREAAEGRRRHA